MLEAAELRQIALCCRHAATMLHLADRGEPVDAARRDRILKANAGQAELLERCAMMLDREAGIRE